MANKGGFSWKRALGVTKAKQTISRKTGIPLTKSGRQRQLGASMGGCLIPAIMILLSLIAIPLFGIDVLINDTPLISDVPAQVVDGRTLVPMRPIFEAFGATVNYDAATQIVIAQKDDKTITFVIGQSTPGMDVPAQIINGRTMIPLRYAGEQVGASVNYTDGIVYISMGDNFATLPPAADQPLQPATIPDMVNKFVIFWGNTGNKLHIDPACRTIKNGVLNGSYEQAIAAGHTEGWCQVCSKDWTDDRFWREGNPYAD
jgi:hypothetical protein